MMNIFVAKLDFGVTSDQLRQEFERFGKVIKATVALDRETGKSRGFAFVEMASKEEGSSAIKALDGKIFNGRPCAVKEADPRPDNRNNRENRENRPNFTPRTDEKPIKKTSESNFEVPPVEIPLKPEIRKKSSKDKKGKIDWDNDSSPKKSKPSIFKSKSKFDDFDDEDDDDLNLLKLRRELEKEDLEEEDED
jgi:RNA recognition motif-containing protein